MDAHPPRRLPAARARRRRRGEHRRAARRWRCATRAGRCDGRTPARTPCSAAREFRPDAVVLDMMLPDFDGMEVLRRLRAPTPDVPVLFLTARDAVEDRVAGLTAGGDDYVTKPFSLEEVVARLRGLMRRVRRGQPPRPSSVLVVGDLDARRGQPRGEPRRRRDRADRDRVRAAALPDAQPAAGAVSKAQILDRVWNYDFGGQANVVELYISYLRKKIDAGREPMIHTMRGAGYVLKPAAELMRHRFASLTSRLVAHRRRAGGRSCRVLIGRARPRPWRCAADLTAGSTTTQVPRRGSTGPARRDGPRPGRPTPARRRRRDRPSRSGRGRRPGRSSHVVDRRRRRRIA